MKVAAVYSRVSTQEQATEGNSLDLQIEKGKAYADLYDWDLRYDHYIDAGVSGSTALADRPLGSKLMLDARDGRFDVIIFTKLDRFSRTVSTALTDFALLDSYGIEVVFIEENIDTTTPSGRMMRTMLLTFAEFERETIRDRVMGGKHAAAAKGGGWSAGGPVPFGYLVNSDGELATNDREAATVQAIFRLKGDGYTLREIVQALHEAGRFPRPRGTITDPRFTPSSISRILSNDIYRGRGVTRTIAPSKGHDGFEFVFDAPRLVTPEAWDDSKAKPESNLRDYPLTGYLYHRHGDETQSAMFGMARKVGGKMERFYRCSASLYGECDGLGYVNGNNVKTVSAAWIESLVGLAEEAGTHYIIQRSDNPKRPSIRQSTDDFEEWLYTP